MHVHVSIVGLDRLGVSFGLALKRYQNQPKTQHTFTIIGSDTRGESMKTAQKMGAVDNFHRTVLKATDNADLIITNVGYGAVEDLYARLGPELKPGAVVLDTSLLKQPVIKLAQQYFRTNAQGQPLAYLVGITPVVNVNGLYSGGIDADAARADLFDNSEILMAPDMSAPSEAIALAEDIVKLVGAKPRFIDPAEHDGLVAATEELPALLSTALFYTLQQSEGWMELRRMINPTFALATQNLRTQTPQDLLALFTENRANLLRHLESLIGRLDQVHDALANSDPAELEAFLAVVFKAWEHWDIKRHSGQWEGAKVPDLLPGPLGSVGNFLSIRRKTIRDEVEGDDED